MAYRMRGNCLCEESVADIYDANVARHKRDIAEAFPQARNLRLEDYQFVFEAEVGGKWVPVQVYIQGSLFDA